jgi:hypothetical protein
MAKTSRYIMGIVLFAMLFQFFAPSFLPVVRETSNFKARCYQAAHSSIVAPILLKEKDEKEHEESSSVSSSIAILDFSDHSINLTATHGCTQVYLKNDHWYDPQPAIHSRYCTFLI